jgi:hypothetical protein
MLSPESLMLSPERRTRSPFPGDAASTSLLVWTHPPLYGLAVQRAKMRVS